MRKLVRQSGERNYALKVRTLSGTLPATGAHKGMARRPILEMTFASNLAYIEIAVAGCCQVARQLGFTDDECTDMCLALRESLNNAIVHGNHRGNGLTVRVRLSGVQGRIEMAVRDQGTGFNPDVVPDPTAPENLLKPCGRGIFLMRHIMDTIGFRFPRGGGTEVLLTRMARPQPGCQVPAHADAHGDRS